MRSCRRRRLTFALTIKVRIFRHWLPVHGCNEHRTQRTRRPRQPPRTARQRGTADTAVDRGCLWRLAGDYLRLWSLAAGAHRADRGAADHAAQFVAARDRPRSPDPLARSELDAGRGATIVVVAVRALPPQPPRAPHRQAAHRPAR